MERFLSASEAARILGVTPSAVRLMAERGDLEVAGMTEGGMRLFKREAVDFLAACRATNPTIARER